MFKTPDDFAAFGKSGLETALKFAQISMDSAERMMKLQLDAARSSFEENSRTAKALAEAKDPQQLMNLRSKLAEQSVEKMLTYSKSVYEVASAAQAELSKLMEQAMTGHSKEVMEAMEKVIKAAPGGASEAAAAAFKTAMSATQTAMENMTKAAHQVTQMADSSIRAATQATADAAKAAAKKPTGEIAGSCSFVGSVPVSGGATKIVRAANSTPAKDKASAIAGAFLLIRCNRRYRGGTGSILRAMRGAGAGHERELIPAPATLARPNLSFPLGTKKRRHMPPSISDCWCASTEFSRSRPAPARFPCRSGCPASSAPVPRRPSASRARLTSASTSSQAHARRPRTTRRSSPAACPCRPSGCACSSRQD